MCFVDSPVWRSPASSEQRPELLANDSPVRLLQLAFLALMFPVKLFLNSQICFTGAVYTTSKPTLNRPCMKNVFSVTLQPTLPRCL